MGVDFKRHFRDTATHSDVDHGDGGLGLGKLYFLFQFRAYSRA